jgi:uncharacterized membrane protein YdfJ with MMPL/SSD domain
MQLLLGQLSQAEAQAAGGTSSAAQARQMQQATAQVSALAARLEADLRALAQSFAGRDAPFSSKVLSLTPQAAQMREAVKQSAEDAQAALSALAKRFEGRDARFLPASVPQSAKQKARQAEINQTAQDLTAALDHLADAVPAEAYFIPAALIKEQPKLGSLVNTYLSSRRTSTQLHVLLALDPYSEAAIDTVNEIEDTAQNEAGRFGMSAYVAGPTVQVRDIHEMVNDDLPRVMALVVGGVLLVFVLLLGSLVAPIYLVATVLLSYGTTMGLITILFQWLLGQSGINYVIPTIILVLLVALGADYNIFLVSRVWEEAGKEGSAREGVRRASAYTGGVITSAGIILAGTFAALTVSPIQTLSQVGTAVALGVLVDTFIVRAMLVPAIAAIVGRLNWWPAKRPAGHGGAFQVIADMFRTSAPRGPRGAHR